MQAAPPSDYHDLTRPWSRIVDHGLTLRGRRADGPGPLIHFASGNGFCGGVYWPFLRPFLDEHGLFVHDFEGQGESDALPRFSGAGAVVRRMQAVAEAEGLTGAPMIGMGHSFGAALTLRLAARHPGMFRAIVLLDPIVFPPALWLAFRLLGLTGRHPLAVATRRRRDRWPSRDQVIERLRDRGIYAGWTEASLAAFADHATRDQGGERVLCCPKSLEAEIYEQPIYPWRDFRRVDCPVLFLHGASSYPFLRPSARLAAATQPRVTVRKLPGGHCFMQEHPEAAHAAVREFLAGC